MNKLSSFARLKLNVVYQSSHRNKFQRESIPKFYIDILARLYSVTQPDAQRGDYITLFSVNIMNQGNAS
jgi:hypothetical protein